MTSGRREALIVGGVGILAAAAGGVAGVLALQSRTGAADLLGARFTDLDGQTRRLLEWRGRALLCNFWATWCAPCREEVPLLVAASRQWRSRGVEIVGIGIDSALKIREFAKTYKIPYPLFVADAAAVSLVRGLGNPGGALPYTVGLDRQGVIVRRHLGALSEAELRQVMESLVG